MKYIVLVLSIFQLAYAGSERVGNGGGVLVCTNKPSVLLDYYEGKKKGYTYDHLETLSKREMNDLFDKRIRYFLPELADILKDLRLAFYERKEDIYNANFQIPDDFYPINLPKKCKLKVAAVQRIPLFSFENMFFIDQNIFQNVDNVTQNGLIQHELLYFISLSEGEKNSVKTREALSYLMSDQFTYSIKDFNNNFIFKISKSLEIFEDDGSDPLSDYFDSLFPEELKWIYLCDRFLKRGYSCPKDTY